MWIGEAARQSGVPARTIRYYERIGVLSSTARTAGGYRDYGDEVLERLAFVRACKAIGFTLQEISELVAAIDGHESPCPQLLELVERRADEIERQVRELSRARVELLRIAAVAGSLARSECPPDAVEALIATRGAEPPLPLEGP